MSCFPHWTLSLKNFWHIVKTQWVCVEWTNAYLSLIFFHPEHAAPLPTNVHCLIIVLKEYQQNFTKDQPTTQYLNIKPRTQALTVPTHSSSVLMPLVSKETSIYLSKDSSSVWLTQWEGSGASHKKKDRFKVLVFQKPKVRCLQEFEGYILFPAPQLSAQDLPLVPANSKGDLGQRPPEKGKSEHIRSIPSSSHSKQTPVLCSTNICSRKILTGGATSPPHPWLQATTPFTWRSRQSSPSPGTSSNQGWSPQRPFPKEPLGVCRFPLWSG